MGLPNKEKFTTWRCIGESGARVITDGTQAVVRSGVLADPGAAPGPVTSHEKPLPRPRPTLTSLRMCACWLLMALIFRRLMRGPHSGCAQRGGVGQQAGRAAGAVHRCRSSGAASARAHLCRLSWQHQGQEVCVWPVKWPAPYACPRPRPPPSPPDPPRHALTTVCRERHSPR